MDDQFLHQARRDPPAEFARKLRASLDTVSANETTGSRTPAARWAAASVAALLIAGAFTVPAVRAGAQAFLDLFRVVNFAAVPVDKNRIQQLGSVKLDLPATIGKDVEVLKQPGPPRTFATQSEASAAAGMNVRLPAWTPVGYSVQSFMVSDEAAMRMTASTEKLRALLDALEIDDLTVPDEIDGQSATIRVPPVVQVVYQHKDDRLMLMQARRPEVAFPAGLDLPQLAEIALRVLGVERGEAHRFAMNIDWRTTLIIPVPTNVASFKQVDIQGNSGLLIEPTEGSGESEDGRRKGRMLLWSAGDSVFALTGSVQGPTLFEIAQSVQ